MFIENQWVLIRAGLRDLAAMKDAMSGMADSEIVAPAVYFAAQKVEPKPAPVQAQMYRLGEQGSRNAPCGTCQPAVRNRLPPTTRATTQRAAAPCSPALHRH